MRKPKQPSSPELPRTLIHKTMDSCWIWLKRKCCRIECAEMQSWPPRKPTTDRIAFPALHVRWAHIVRNNGNIMSNFRWHGYRALFCISSNLIRFAVDCVLHIIYVEFALYICGLRHREGELKYKIYEKQTRTGCRAERKKILTHTHEQRSITRALARVRHNWRWVFSWWLLPFVSVVDKTFSQCNTPKN